jgi:hypothetical protein
MRKLIALIVVFSTLIVLAGVAIADGTPRQRKKQPRATAARAKTVATEDVVELLRRAQASAEAAQAEARRAREQSEALQQKLDQTTQELAAIRRQLAESKGASIESRLADLRAELKVEIGRLQSAIADSKAQTAPAAKSLAPTTDERLSKLEEQVEVNSAQIKEHAQTKIESDSRFRVRLHGMVLANTYLNTSDISLRSSPTGAPAPSTPPVVSRRNVGATLRQTTLGLAMSGPRAGGARLSAETEFDFYGGAFGDYEGNVLGALRLRTASMNLDWERASLVAGLRQPMISPLNPSSLAAVWQAPFAEAGNLWQWRPQLILEHRLAAGESSEVILQGGLMTTIGEFIESVVVEGGLNYQGRIAFRRRLDDDHRIEFGLGGFAGRRSFPLKRRLTAYAISADWLLPFGPRFELSGEAYFGRGNNLAQQGGSRADSVYALSGPLSRATTTVRGVHTAGGWTQLTFKARRDLDFNFAFGAEDPRNRDLFDGALAPATRFANRVASANFIYQLRSNFLISLEYRRLLSDYLAERRRSDHYNLAFGYTF